MSEPAPWNLVFHSIFKLDSQNLGVLWYDLVVGNDKTTRIVRTSVYNIFKNTWRSLRITQTPQVPRSPASPSAQVDDGNKESDRELSFRFGTDMVPVYSEQIIMQE